MNAVRGRAAVTIIILALILGWLVLDQLSGPNPIRDGFSRAFTPLQYVIKSVYAPLAQLWASVTNVGGLSKENQRLLQENLELRNQILLLREAQIENQTLRRQLGYKSTVPSMRLLSAEVIGHDPNSLLSYLIIDRGAQDGIRKGMPVLAAEGLVGRISEVSSSSAKVLLITDLSSSVSALIQRSRATGMVQGSAGHELLMRFIPQGDTVEVEDVVLTAGLGGNFPKRLVIGQVSSVKRSDVEMFQEARIIPSVNLRDLESVMVLLSFQPVESSAASESVAQAAGQ